MIGGGNMIPYDKKLHLLAGFLICIIGTVIFHNVLIGFGLSVLAGLLKELRDKLSEKGTCELLDFIYTALGGLIGTLLFFGGIK
jgi:hypothetical protein